MKEVSADLLLRRRVLKAGLGLGMAMVLPVRHALASGCALTPPQTEGPFYPVAHRLDEDSDLTWVVGKSQQAAGQVIYVGGWVSDERCQPVAQALVEIWQACTSGRYDHPTDTNPAPLDPYFQYWGRAVSDADGRYLFKTILPGAYPADVGWIRPPHIHFKAHRRGYVELTTQMYFAGNPYNADDRILQRLPPASQEQVVIAPQPSPDEPTVSFFSFDLTLQKA